MAEAAGTILLVDDDATVREVLAEHLLQQGFDVIQGENGEEGVALALGRLPDLIVSDIVMPRMDGWDFCYTLRLMPSTKTIPFVFLTSLDKTPDKVMGIKLGADDYLTKPFSPPEVVFKVKAILRRVRMRRELFEKQQAKASENDARFLLADFIEYLRHTVRTGLLAIYTPQGEKGIIYIRQGHPVHASIGYHTGEAAVYEMLRVRQADVKYVEKEYSELPDNISLTWESLMARVLNGPAER